jgi:hypothetical protein
MPFLKFQLYTSRLPKKTAGKYPFAGFLMEKFSTEEGITDMTLKTIKH